MYDRFISSPFLTLVLRPRLYSEIKEKALLVFPDEKYEKYVSFEKYVPPCWRRLRNTWGWLVKTWAK